MVRPYTTFATVVGLTPAFREISLIVDMAPSYKIQRMEVYSHPLSLLLQIPQPLFLLADHPIEQCL